MSTELLPGKHLFVDDFRIQEMHAARRVLHQPEKHPLNPVLRPERPWEKVSLHAGRLRLRRGAGMLPSLVHLRVATVIGTRVLVRDNPPKEFREYQICYAESAGGVHWERPHLGITAGRPTGRRARSAGGTATTSSTGAGTGRPGEPPRRHPRPGVLLPAGSGANQTWAGPLPRHARRLPGRPAPQVRPGAQRRRHRLPASLEPRLGPLGALARALHPPWRAGLLRPG